MTAPVALPVRPVADLLYEMKLRAASLREKNYIGTAELLEEAGQRLSDSVSLLREADQLWTTSWANQNRGVWDTDWNERRVAFLATFVAEKATTSEAPK